MTFPLRRTAVASIAAASVIALLAACGSAPSTSNSSSKAAAASSYLPCMLSDVSGFNDHSFNELTLAGLQQAAKSLGTTEKHVQSTTANDYASNISNLVAQKCNFIVAPGFNLVASVKAAAAKNPKVDFAMIDDNSIKAANVKDVVFNTNEAGFLGGYIAAAYSTSKVVATWGGAQYPSVTIYMDGIADGVAYYNKQKNADVKLLGWDEKTQKGSFVGGFTDQNKAKSLTAGFLGQKADVIIPVAGNLYQGAAAAIKAVSGSKAVLEGVDADVFVSDPTYGQYMLVSILKNLQPATNAIVTQAASGKTFDNTQYVGTLKNNGVAISPFHDFTSKVPSTLAGELKTIEAGLIAGTITADSPSSFK